MGLLSRHTGLGDYGFKVRFIRLLKLRMLGDVW